MTGTVPPLPRDRPLLVWGNCQAAPLADLLRAPLAAWGTPVVDVPPVFEATPDDVERVRGLLAEGSALVSQPVRDEYHVPGCGTAQLAALLPADARLVTFPVTYDISAFPYQVNGHGADGMRVTAPLTDYHDLRVLAAARRGSSVEEALDGWPVPDAAVVRASAEASRAELARREAGLDVSASDLLGPSAMFTLSHPQNSVLAAVAWRVLAVLGVPDDGLVVPEREYLGERQAPVEPAVVEALGWPADAVRPDWVVQHRHLGWPEVLEVQLPFYADRPDVVADAFTRYDARARALGLA